MNNDTEQLIPNCDLSEYTFAEAVGKLKVLPEQAWLVCAHENAATAQKIRDQYHCTVMLVPKEILVNGSRDYSTQHDVWCVMHGQRAVWSPGS